MLLTPGRCILAASDIYFDHGRLPTDGRSYKEQDLMELTLASKDHLICALDHALTAMEDRYLELTFILQRRHLKIKNDRQFKRQRINVTSHTLKLCQKGNATRIRSFVENSMRNYNCICHTNNGVYIYIYIRTPATEQIVYV